jgi:hypothetical protein
MTKDTSSDAQEKPTEDTDLSNDEVDAIASDGDISEQSAQNRLDHPLAFKSPFEGMKLEYKDDSDIDLQLKTIRETGDFMAARERYEAGLEAQQADSPGDAINAMLRNRTAGEGPEAMADKMIEYTLSQHAVRPESETDLSEGMKDSPVDNNTLPADNISSTESSDMPDADLPES